MPHQPEFRRGGLPTRARNDSPTTGVLGGDPSTLEDHGGAGAARCVRLVSVVSPTGRVVRLQGLGNILGRHVPDPPGLPMSLALSSTATIKGLFKDPLSPSSRGPLKDSV